MKRPIPLMRSSHRPVSVTKRSSGDSAAVNVRAGDKVLGSIAQLGSGSDDRLAGGFSNTPAFADYADTFRALADALQGHDTGAIAAAQADLEARAVHVWHSVHDMRIDEPGSLSIAGGRTQFRANAAYLMLRTGGL